MLVCVPDKKNERSPDYFLFEIACYQRTLEIARKVISFAYFESNFSSVESLQMDFHSSTSLLYLFCFILVTSNWIAKLIQSSHEMQDFTVEKEQSLTRLS